MSLASRKRSEECLSDLVLDTLIAGDLSPELSASARSHAGACEACRMRWLELSSQAESPLPALSPGRAARGVAPAPVTPSRRRGVASALPRWLALAAAVSALLLFGRFALREDALPGERLKGGGRLGFFVQRGAEVSRGGPGELLHPGDALQFTFFAPGAGYLVVLGRDASGAVSVYYPSAPAAAPVVAGEQTLPASTLLDHTLGAETIEAVFCTSQLEVEAVRGARQARKLEVDGCSVDTLQIVKEAP